MRTIIASILAFSVLCSGCGVAPMRSASRLDDLQLGMDKNEVKSKLGEPDEVRESYENEKGQKIEAWQYELRTISAGQAFGNIAFGVIFYTITWWVPAFKDDKSYWVQFSDDKVFQWGRVGDLQLDKKEMVNY